MWNVRKVRIDALGVAIERDERTILLGLLRLRLPAGSSDGLGVECGRRKALVTELLSLVDVRLMRAHGCDRPSMAAVVGGGLYRLECWVLASVQSSRDGWCGAAPRRCVGGRSQVRLTQQQRELWPSHLFLTTTPYLKVRSAKVRDLNAEDISLTGTISTSL